MHKNKVHGKTRKFLTTIRQKTFAILIFLIIWEIAPRLGIIESTYLPPFSEAVNALFKLAISGVLFKHILVSLARALSGFGLSVLIGIPLGVLIGWKRPFAQNINPLLQTFRQTSPLALLPAFMLFFGIGEVSKVTIVFWGSFWPILMNTLSGVQNTPPLLIKMSQSMGSSQLGLVKNIILPSASPSIFTGLKLSASTAIIMLTAAEMVGANAGIGYLVLYSQQVFRVADLYAAIITIALIGLAFNYLINRLERKVLFWREELPE